MNKHSSILLLFLLFASLSTFAQGDFPEPPNPPRLVNDFSNTLTEAQRSALENKLVAYNDSTSTQISVVLIRSVGQYDISDYTFSWAKNGE
jgi:uncharacterized protein